MIENFPLLQQRLGSNSCLPTAVTAILQYFEHDVSEDQVSEWCQEGTDGCVIDLAMQGLRDQDYDVNELTDDPENQIRQYVNDADNPYPVLVTIMPTFSTDMDHAVVVIGFADRVNEEAQVSLMDPLCGCIRTVTVDEFLLQWDNAGRLAFLITP